MLRWTGGARARATAKRAGAGGGERDGGPLAPYRLHPASVPSPVLPSASNALSLGGLAEVIETAAPLPKNTPVFSRVTDFRQTGTRHTVPTPRPQTAMCNAAGEVPPTGEPNAQLPPSHASHVFPAAAASFRYPMSMPRPGGAVLAAVVAGRASCVIQRRPPKSLPLHSCRGSTDRALLRRLCLKAAASKPHTSKQATS